MPFLLPVSRIVVPIWTNRKTAGSERPEEDNLLLICEFSALRQGCILRTDHPVKMWQSNVKVHSSVNY
jgi:hypothetical protein